MHKVQTLARVPMEGYLDEQNQRDGEVDLDYELSDVI